MRFTAKTSFYQTTLTREITRIQKQKSMIQLEFVFILANPDFQQLSLLTGLSFVNKVEVFICFIFNSNRFRPS